MPDGIGTLQSMEFQTKNEAILKKYLLGDISSEEQEELELWLMSSEDAYDLLEAAEDDLIDDSLAGRLDEHELNLFNRHFLAAPERQRKLQFSRSFRRAIDSATQPPPVSSPTRQSYSLWTMLLGALRYRPILVYAGSALVLILLIGNVWSVMHTIDLQRELRSTQNQLADVGRDRDDLKRQLEESQALASTLGAQLSVQTSTATTKPSTVPVQLALNLMPGITRSSSEIKQLSLTPNATLVSVSLILTDDNFTAYRVSLMNADGREIWSQNKIAPQATNDGKAVVFSVPTTVLSNDDYSFGLMGVPDSGTPESIGRYYFRAVRQ